jgi:hypothetical protein
MRSTSRSHGGSVERSSPSTKEWRRARGRRREQRRAERQQLRQRMDRDGTHEGRAVRPGNLVFVEPDKMRAARKAGASPWEVHECAVAGEFAPTTPHDPRRCFCAAVWAVRSGGRHEQLGHRRPSRRPHRFRRFILLPGMRGRRLDRRRVRRPAHGAHATSLRDTARGAAAIVAGIVPYSGALTGRGAGMRWAAISLLAIVPAGNRAKARSDFAV